jgi:hypothetical protein
MEGFMAKKSLLSAVLLLFMLSLPAWGAESSCVNCHTDEAALKSLFKAPKIEGGEGEG